MKQITLRIHEDELEDVDEEADEQDVSRSEYIRDVIESRHEVDELRTEVEELRTEVARKERRVEAILSQRDEKQELVKYAEQNRDLQEARARAGIATRAKWWLFGMDDEQDE